MWRRIRATEHDGAKQIRNMSKLKLKIGAYLKQQVALSQLNQEVCL